MAEDEVSQESIKFYLDAFLPYICECVTATDLLVHLPSFNKAERKEIFSLSTKRPTEATKLAIETLLKKDEPGMYRAIKEAMGPDQANVPKIFEILSGKLIPSQEEDQYKAIIQLFMDELIGRINPTEILPHLNEGRVFGVGETEEIKCEERYNGQRRGAWLLLYYLPQRVDDWFKMFLKALIAQNQNDLAEKLDPDLYAKIMVQQADTNKNKDTNVNEEKEDVLEVFVDAIDDRNLLKDFEEKYDQEISEKERDVEPQKAFKDGLEDQCPNMEEWKMSTNVANISEKSNSSETSMKELKEVDVSHTAETNSNLESTASKLIKDNLDARIEQKSSYLKTLQPVEHTNGLSKKESSPLQKKRLPVFDSLAYTGSVISDDGTSYQSGELLLKQKTMKEESRVSSPGEKKRLPVFDSMADKVSVPNEDGKLSLHGEPGLIQQTQNEEMLRRKLKYDSKYLRRLQHSNLAPYPTQAFLRVPELFERESRSQIAAAPTFEIKGNNYVLAQTNAKCASRNQQSTDLAGRFASSKLTDRNNLLAPQKSSIPEDGELDLSSFLPSDRIPRTSVGVKEPSATDEDILKELIVSLNSCLLKSEAVQGDVMTLYDRNEEETTGETVNDLSTMRSPPPIATDFDNIELQKVTEIKLRQYQEELAEEGCQGENVIILAPTNSGKTWVACRIIQEHFRRSEGHKIAKCAFIVENTALAQQQGELCAELLNHLRTKVISGDIQREKKEYLKDFVDRRDILVVTAKVLHNTLKQKDIDSITKFSLLVFDECHHTQSDHPYNEIMNIYHGVKSKNGIEVQALPQIVGLTASLGVGKEVTKDKTIRHMLSVMANLDSKYLCRVKKNQRELDQYMNTPDEEIIVVPNRVNDSFRSSVSKVMVAIEGVIKRTTGCLIPVDAVIVNKLVKSIPANKGSQPYIQWLSDLRKALVAIHSEDMRRVLNACRMHLIDYNQAILLYTDARVEDALEILEKKIEQKRNAVNTCIEKIMLNIYDKLKVIDFKECSFNPKLAKVQDILLEVLGKNQDARGIIFVKTRQLAEYMIKWMKETDALQALNPTAFVGQAASAQLGGMTKHEQKDVLVYFKDGLHQLIVATSVAEEGLDITKCNLVIRYEHVTNEIVRAQSRGRARAPNSKYYVITERGSPIADKEEKNVIAEKMMNDAAIDLEQIIENNRNNFEAELIRLQFSAKVKRETKQKKKDEKVVNGDYEFRCLNCNNYVCMASDIRKIQGAHHVCISDDVRERVTLERSPIPEFAENDMKMDGATFCNDCKHPLGGVCDYKGIEFPLLKVQYFRLVDMHGKGSHSKKWKGVPCIIQEIDLDDLRKFAYKDSDSD